MLMMRKKRGYKRDTPIELVRDYKLFAIACEGHKTEPAYFHLFRYMSSKIAVDIIDEIVGENEALLLNPNRSAPKWVLDRAIRYVEKEGLNNEDELWFVMDVDRWSLEQLREIADYCDKHANWNVVLSNPCFEVWLYFHKKANIKSSKSKNGQDFKNEISTLEKGGYHPYKFIPHLPDAIKNAKDADTDPAHFMPKFKETKVYQLGEALMHVIRKKEFDEFLETILPTLIKAEIEKTKISKSLKKK